MTNVVDPLIQSSSNRVHTLIRPPELEVVNLTKRFGTFTALENVSMKLKPGSFHALMGENGAGKSTLVKCIMGFYIPTSGEVLVDGKVCQIRSPSDAHAYGIGMVYQRFTSVPSMTVAENLVLSRFDATNLINWKKELADLSAFMATAPFKVPLDMLIGQLAAGQKQKLEILKQLYLQSKILILDEPTSVLTPAEAAEVLGLIREQVTDGKLSVLMISHKFHDITAFVDDVTVLRKGKLAGNGRVKDMTVSEIAEMMMGEKQEPQKVAKTVYDNPKAVLQIKDIHANKDNGLEAVGGVNLTIHSGEIVGIAGISGNGQRELVEVLAGQRPATAGEVLIDGDVYQMTRAQMYQHHVSVLPEDPLRNACIAGMSVAENLALHTFDRPPLANGILLNLKALREMAVGLINAFKIKTSSPETPLGKLSGGNIQRTVLARELSDAYINLLIAANPCFGLDFAMVDYIHGKILEARNRGVAVLLVSEDLDELLKLSDRILVINGGSFDYESNIEDADLYAIGQSMAGH